VKSRGFSSLFGRRVQQNCLGRLIKVVCCKEQGVSRFASGRSCKRKAGQNPDCGTSDDDCPSTASGLTHLKSAVRTQDYPFRVNMNRERMKVEVKGRNLQLMGDLLSALFLNSVTKSHLAFLEFSFWSPESSSSVAGLRTTVIFTC
jgi:hypothetical protein